MSKHDYMPRRDDLLLVWARNILGYVTIHHLRWGLMPPSDKLRALFEDFERALQISKQANSGNVDKSVKNMAKKSLTTALRNYIQGNIARNSEVTNADKTAMYLPIYDKTLTPVGVPVGTAKIIVLLTRPAQLLLSIMPCEDERQWKRVYYSYRIHYGVYAAGDTKPVYGADLPRHISTRHKKELIHFNPEDSGKIAYFCIRYENTRGKAGPWGLMTSAVIP